MQAKPEKLYYSISEVAEITGVKPHVLRYWEEQFPTLSPKKSRSGNRCYRWRDIEEALAIKRLLYSEGFRIEGALRIRREAHAAARRANPETEAPQLTIPFQDLDRQQQIAHLRTELANILALVKGLKVPAPKRPPSTER